MLSPNPEIQSLARVVAIGLHSAVESIDPTFYTWAKEGGVIDENTIVIEWIGENPLAHEDSTRAQVGNYMILDSINSGKFVRRGDNWREETT